MLWSVNQYDTIQQVCSIHNQKPDLFCYIGATVNYLMERLPSFNQRFGGLIPGSACSWDLEQDTKPPKCSRSFDYCVIMSVTNGQVCNCLNMPKYFSTTKIWKHSENVSVSLWKLSFVVLLFLGGGIVLHSVCSVQQEEREDDIQCLPSKDTVSLRSADRDLITLHRATYNYCNYTHTHTDSNL